MNNNIRLDLHPTFVVIWNGALRPVAPDKFGFAEIADYGRDEHCTYADIDLTAEEVGQLLGGS